MTVVSEPVEDLISEAMLTRLDSTELAGVRRLDDLAWLYADGAVSAREWMAARNPIESRICDIQRRLARATETSALEGLLGNVAVLRGQWTHSASTGATPSSALSLTTP